MDAVDHVVLGAGAVGMAVAEALARQGESVRVVNRSGLREPVAGVRSATGDVSDPAFAASATRGARVVYQALNPPYHRWAQEFPALQAAAVAAAQAAGARLVAMDNVYMYGRANGRPFTEECAYDPHTRKGRVRAAMARDLMAAHDAGHVQVTVGRASDFFGPRAGRQSLIGDWVIPPALADKPASPLARVAGSHHERLDGSGYHRGAEAAQLDVGARLLAAADAYDAMTHDRPHRPALTAEQARARLGQAVRGGVLDKRTVDAVLEAAGAAPLQVRQARPAGLSEREVEILRLLAQSRTAKQIAQALTITEKTAGHHIEHIYAKTGVSTRVGAALFAMQHDPIN